MNNSHTHIDLIGSATENFYQLGVRDRNAFKELNKLAGKLCTQDGSWAKIIKSSALLSRQFSFNKYQDHHFENFKAYSEGLGVPLNDVLFTYVLPELVTAFNHWPTDLLRFIPGCSSLFVSNSDKSGVIHSRILDYAAVNVFDKYERTISYQLSGDYKIFSFGSSGVPLPSLTAVNEKGLTLALHYKYGKEFYPDGDSIFMLAYDILAQCSDIREALKFLKKSKSMSTWGLYLSDSNSEVMSVDICGNLLTHEKFQMHDHKYLYFNNLPVRSSKYHKSLRPYFHETQCNMRANTIKERMKNFDYQNKNLQKKLLMILTRPPKSFTKNINQWSFDLITPCSLQAVSINNTAFNALSIHGETPKFYLGEVQEHKDFFSEYSTKLSQQKIEGPQLEYKAFMRHWTLFQSSYDQGNITKSYHYLQLAIEDSPKDSVENSISHFYFLVIQFIHENDPRDLSYIYKEFLELENKLPKHLEEHRLLFLLRLEIILDYGFLEREKSIEHPLLRQRYHEEKLKPALALRNMRKLIFPRIDISDILYAY